MSDVGIYVHVPFCLTRCGYCDFNAYAGLDHLAPRYVRALLAEAGLAAPAWAEDEVVSVFVGGGTPTTLDVADKRFFQGLPSPAAACLVAGLVWALNEYQIRGQDVKWLAWGLTLFSGLSMVSNLKFYSGKDINLRGSVPFSVVVGITFGLVALFMFSSTLPEMLFLLFVCYGVSGYVIWTYEQVRSRTVGRAPPPAPPAPGA